MRIVVNYCVTLQCWNVSAKIRSSSLLFHVLSFRDLIFYLTDMYWIDMLSILYIQGGPLPLYLTTSKAVAIVWRLRGNIIRPVFYWQKQFIQPGWVLSLSFYVLGWMIYLCVCVCFQSINQSKHISIAPYVASESEALHLGQLSHFPSYFGVGVTKLNESPSSFLLPSHYCRLWAGFFPLRAIVNKKQCETRGYLCRWLSTTE